MIGPLEIAILAVVLLLIFGYRKLPQLGRSAGEGARALGEGAKELAGSANEKVGDRIDPARIGRSAGKGVREAREFRDSLTGSREASSGSGAKAAPPADGERPVDADADAERRPSSGG